MRNVNMNTDHDGTDNVTREPSLIRCCVWAMAAIWGLVMGTIMLCKISLPVLHVVHFFVKLVEG
jgi:hypothetical protein